VKIRNLFILSFVLLLAVSIVNCGGEKTEKDKAIDLAESLYNFMKSDEAKKMNEDGDIGGMFEKFDTLAKEAGFKDFEEGSTALEKYEDDPDMQEWKNKIEALDNEMGG
jgi:hypothetical protein